MRSAVPEAALRRLLGVVCLGLAISYALRGRASAERSEHVTTGCLRLSERRKVIGNVSPLNAAMSLVSQSCYKLKFVARLRRAARARESAFRLPPQPDARGDGRWVARSFMPKPGDKEHVRAR